MKTLNIGSGKYKDNNGEWSTLPCLKGDEGDTGESAYQLAVRLGTFTGTEEEYNEQFFEIVRKTNAAEKSIKEAENKIQENIKNIDSLSKDLKTKINIPLENPEIGKILKIKSINEDGTFVCEWQLLMYKSMVKLLYKMALLRYRLLKKTSNMVYFVY